MIQFNLLPDVKLQYLRATYRKRIIIFVSIVASAAFLLIFVLLFLFVRVNQPRHITNLDKDIGSEVSTLQAIPDLDRILTIQNQLNTLPGLHEEKVFSSRLFEYLAQLTPQTASITNADVDLEAFTISLKGEADTLATVNKFVDTIKFTDYSVEGEESSKGKAFSAVVLQSFSVAAQGQTGVTYQIDFVYEPTIFADSAKKDEPTANAVKLNVPKIVTTRSETQKPEGLFQQRTQPEPALQTIPEPGGDE